MESFRRNSWSASRRSRERRYLTAWKLGRDYRTYPAYAAPELEITEDMAQDLPVAAAAVLAATGCASVTIVAQEFDAMGFATATPRSLCIRSRPDMALEIDAYPRILERIDGS